MMEAKFTGSVLVATLISFGAAALTAEAQTPPSVATLGGMRYFGQLSSTVFHCVRKGDGFATIAQRGDRRTPPVITWSYTLGRQYNPQQRCNIVSQKLTQTVARNGGKLKNLQLVVGPVKNQLVVCVVNMPQFICNSSNMLFTLRPENARRADQVIARLNNFSAQGSGAPVAESAGLDSLPLENLNRFLDSEHKTNSVSPKTRFNR